MAYRLSMFISSVLVITGLLRCLARKIGRHMATTRQARDPHPLNKSIRITFRNLFAHGPIT